MANPQKGELEIEVAGTRYLLALDLNALCEFQELMYPGDPDFDMGVVIGRIGKGNLILSRALLWATTRKHHADLTMKDVGLLVTEFGYKPWMELLPRLLEFMQPDASDRATLKAAPKTGPLNAQDDGIGARSTSKRAKSA